MMRIGGLCFAAATLCNLLSPISASADEYRVSFLAHDTPSSLASAERHTVALTLRNTGTLPWKRSQLFRLAYHWVDNKGKVAVMDGVRTELPRDVGPGETVQLCASLIAPSLIGVYELRWDMVQEQRTWFSARDPTNVLATSVAVVPAPPVPLDWRALFAVGAFWLLTLGPLLLTAFWIHAWWGQEIASLDEYFFHVVVFGVGHLYLVLHVLVFTSGLSLTAAGLTLATIHATIAAAFWRTRTGRPIAPGAPSALLVAKRPPVLALAGASVMLSLFIQWAWASPRGMEILGTDAANYHVPHALNLLRGVNPFDFLATPHVYPMGTSVWAAWFFQPFDDPLLLELATAPAFLLLFGSTCLLFRLLTNRSGLRWAPWALLLAFTGQLPRISRLMSADLAYAAAFVALTTQVLAIWEARRLDIRHALAAALCAGLLVSSKSTGVFSLAYIACFGLLAIVALRRRGIALPGVTLAPVATAIVLFVASGGVWIIRNWWLYGSPLAPYGLSIFGTRLLPGQSPSGMRYYLSVLGDLQREPGYPLFGRFSNFAREMFGRWILPVGVLAVLLPVDLALQLRRHDRLSRQARTKLLFGGLLIMGFAVHAVVVAGLPWTSLDWTKGVSLRYLLPFFLLYIFTLYCFAFTDEFDSLRAPALRAIGAIALVSGALWYYHANEATPGLPPDRWIAVLHPATLLTSAVLVVSTYLALTNRFRPLNTTILVVLGAALMAGLSYQSVLDRARIVRDLVRESRTESSCAEAGVPPLFDHRGLYLRVVAFQQSNNLSCERTRFFVVSRFDRPLDLQDAQYHNVVLDAGASSQAALKRWGPRPGGCDIVVAAKADLESRATEWLGDVLQTPGPSGQIAEYGRYAAYVMK